MKSGRTQVEIIALYEELGQLSRGRIGGWLRSQDGQALRRRCWRCGAVGAGADALTGDRRGRGGDRRACRADARAKITARWPGRRGSCGRRAMTVRSARCAARSPTPRRRGVSGRRPRAASTGRGSRRPASGCCATRERPARFPTPAGPRRAVVLLGRVGLVAVSDGQLFLLQSVSVRWRSGWRTASSRSAASRAWVLFDNPKTIAFEPLGRRGRAESRPGAPGGSLPLLTPHDRAPGPRIQGQGRGARSVYQVRPDPRRGLRLTRRGQPGRCCVVSAGQCRGPLRDQGVAQRAPGAPKLVAAARVARRPASGCLRRGAQGRPAGDGQVSARRATRSRTASSVRTSRCRPAIAMS